MFLTSEASVKWRRRALVLFLLLVASYVWHASQEGFTHGGTAVGQAYGYLAAGLIVLLILYAVRKRAYRSRLGTLEGWCQAHVYLGLLVVALVLLHSGFRFQDRVAVAALIVMALVAASGLAGAILYTSVPRLLTEVGSEPNVEEISEQLNQLGRSMQRLAEGGSAALGEVHGFLRRESTPKVLAGWRTLARRVGRGNHRAQLRDHLQEVPRDEQALLRQLLVLSRQHQELHRRLAAQQRYRNLLQVWLYLHLPLTVALVVLVTAHVVAVYHYT